MKKTYMTPAVLVVVLLNEDMIAESIHDVNAGNDGPGHDDGEYNGGANTKGSTNVWDEEW